MPITDGPQWLNVTVQVNGRDLPEYGTLANEGNLRIDGEPHEVPDGMIMEFHKLTRFIEGRPGQKFSIKIDRPEEFVHQFHHVGYYIEIDGQPECFVHERGWNAGRPFEKVIDCIYWRATVNGPFTHREFFFSDLSNGPGNRGKDDDGINKMGLIEVQAFHMSRSVRMPPNAEHIVTDNDLYYMDQLSDRTLRTDREAILKKFNELRVSGIHVPFPETFPQADILPDLRSRKGISAPFATFKFRYRTKEALEKKEGVVGGKYGTKYKEGPYRQNE
ncbi:hypothetical protein G7054_g3483 [Neopestalotiopsis clavispora]|nr:hypothetical protein G7054_g3483 [Neopestalotiopsis clavispora]